MSNEVISSKAVEYTVEDMNEWVDGMNAEIDDAKMVVKALGREAKASNDK